MIFRYMLFVVVLLVSLPGSARSVDCFWVPVYDEQFSTDIFGSGDWIRSDASVLVDTANGWLHIGTGGTGYKDYAEKTLSFSLPVKVETRMKLVSSGRNYRLPWFVIYYGTETEDEIRVTYLFSDTHGWNFKAWTNIHTIAPESENVWRTVSAIVRTDGGELLAKSDSDTTFTSIVVKNWSISDSIVKIRYEQPWDAVCDIDYITVSICDTVPDFFSLISPPDADSVKAPITFTWQTSIDPDPNDTVWYDLYLSRFPDFYPDSIVHKGLLDTIFVDSVDFTDTNDIRLWHWKVKASDKWGAETWSNETTWSFYVYVCGDCNGDGQVTISDVVCLVNYVLKDGPVLVPLDAGDVNCDGYVDIIDAVYLVNYLFKDGPPPCDPNGDSIPDC